MSIIKQNGNLFPSVFSDLFDTEKFFGTDLFRDLNKQLPAVNITEGEKSFRIELAVPGFKKDAIKVDVENEVITISGENKEEKKEENEKFTRREFSYGSFTRSFQLPKAADGEAISAKYENGILQLEIAKKEEAVKKDNKKQIQIS